MMNDDLCVVGCGWLLVYIDWLCAVGAVSYNCLIDGYVVCGFVHVGTCLVNFC